MEAPVISVTSLPHAVKEILAAGGSKWSASVTGVRVEDVPAMVSLLSALETRCKVANRRRLKRLEIAADLLTIVGSALLPVLADDPTHKRARDFLHGYAMRIRDNARVVGASFGKEATVVADRMLNYLNQARRPAALLSSQQLVHFAHDIKRVIDDFKRSEFTLLLEDEQRDGDDDGEEGDDKEAGEEGDDDDDSRPPPYGPQMLRGRPLVAAPTIRVTSLRTALEAALEAGGNPRNVLVASVHLRHATALQELLRFEDIRHGWRVLNPDRTNAVILADNTLRVISAGILPSLAEDPTGDRLLNITLGCANKLKRCAESLGGSSSSHVRTLADLLLDHVRTARRQSAVAASALVASGKGFVARIANLRSQQVTVLEDV